MSQEDKQPVGEGSIKPEEATLESLNSAPVVEKQQDVVPLSKYMEEKRERKALEARIAELESVKSKPTSEDLRKLADEHGADPELLEALEKRWGTKQATEKVVDPELKKELEEIKQEQQKEKTEKIFNSLWDKAMEVAPEYKGVADKNVLRQLSFLPENRHLTLSGLMEKVYGGVVKGNKTIETVRPSGKEKGVSDIDFKKMSDSDWEVVKENPELKKKYNEYLVETVKNNL